MAISKNQLRSIRIFNEHDYADGNPYIFYRPQSLGRFSINAAWLISYPGHVFKNVPWYDYGNLAFNVYSPKKDKEKQLQEAQKKFIEIFNVEELAKTPFGSWMDKQFVEKRNEEIKQLLKNLENNKE